MDYNDRTGTNPFAAPKAHGAGEPLEPRNPSPEVLPYSSKTASTTARAAAWRLSGRVMSLSAGTLGSLFNPSP